MLKLSIASRHSASVSGAADPVERACRDRLRDGAQQFERCGHAQLFWVARGR
jgi:hypothetical protein